MLPLYAALAAFAVILATDPQTYAAACTQGIALWANCVLPALFPFMVITLILIRTGGTEAMGAPFGPLFKKLNLPKAAAGLFFMSAVSGYPAGSRMLAEFYGGGRLTKDAAGRLAPLCSTSGPMFILGSVGGMLEGGGAALLAAHLASVAATGLALCAAKRSKPGLNKTVNPTAAGQGDVLYDCFYGAVTAVVLAGGFICFFNVLCTALENIGFFMLPEAALEPLLGGAAAGVCRGLIEATGGCARVIECGGRLALPITGFLITFGGLSIILQQLCYLTKCGVKPLAFIAAKALQGGVCFLLLLPFAMA